MTQDYRFPFLWETSHNLNKILTVIPEDYEVWNTTSVHHISIKLDSPPEKRGKKLTRQMTCNGQPFSNPKPG